MSFHGAEGTIQRASGSIFATEVQLIPKFEASTRLHNWLKGKLEVGASVIAGKELMSPYFAIRTLADQLLHALKL